MRIDILTLFPETLGDVLSESILGRAQERGFIRIKFPPDPGLHSQQAEPGG